MTPDRIAGCPGRALRLVIIRMAPAVVAVLVSAVLFLPAHVRLEPASADERIGLVPLLLAFAGLVALVRGTWRFGAMAWSSVRFARATPRPARCANGAGWIEMPLFRGIALAGIIRPRILIGSVARRVLTAAELEVAVAHELAHQRAGDNLTRALMRCAPDFFGWTRAARRVESLWEAEAECLADAEAAGGSPCRAAHLAAALVKVARLGQGAPDWSPGWSSLHHAVLLETRVRRLVSEPPVNAGSPSGAAAALLAATAVATAWMTDLPRELHRLTETIIALVP